MCSLSYVHQFMLLLLIVVGSASCCIDKKNNRRDCLREECVYVLMTTTRTQAAEPITGWLMHRQRPVGNVSTHSCGNNGMQVMISFY